MTRRSGARHRGRMEQLEAISMALYKHLYYNADAYAAAEDEASAYRLLVERVETIIAEEQQLFWQAQ